MKNNVPFWGPEFSAEMREQSEFYEHLDKSNHLKDTLYRPAKLGKRESGKRTRIADKKFEGVSFSHTRISDIIFRNCEFSSCQFVDSIITNCEFYNCRFMLTNTHKIKIAKTLINPRCFRECLVASEHQNVGVHLYQQLLKNSRDLDQPEFAREAQFLFLRWKRLQDKRNIKRFAKPMQSWRDMKSLQLRKRSQVCGRWLWEVFFGCGIRLLPYVRTVIGFTLVSWALNFLLQEQFGIVRKGIAASGWADSLYFTVISLTSVGYGDIVPTSSLGKVWACFQAASGFILLALLASTIYRRIAP